MATKKYSNRTSSSKKSLVPLELKTYAKKHNINTKFKKTGTSGEFIDWFLDPFMGGSDVFSYYILMRPDKTYEVTLQRRYITTSGGYIDRMYINDFGRESEDTPHIFDSLTESKKAVLNHLSKVLKVL